MINYMMQHMLFSISFLNVGWTDVLSVACRAIWNDSNPWINQKTWGGPAPYQGRRGDTPN